MDKEQQRRMASQEFVGTDPKQTEITYTVQISDGRVELHRQWAWDEDDDEYPMDSQHDCWIMSVDDLKKLVECANRTIQKSEEFEAAHPLVNEQ